MAAIAATAIGSSSFSPAIHTRKCVRFKNLAVDHSLIRVPSTRLMPSLSHSYSVHEPLSLGGTTPRWRVLKVSAEVAQEEVAVAAPDEAGVVEEEEKGGEQVRGDGEAEAEAETHESPVNTKLYFGNLPYSVDSAQLAGIIQEYGSPELVEVLYERESGRNRGFAFVTMSSIEDCNAVIQNLDGSEYLGRILRVNFSDKPKPKQPLYPETEHKLFIGNLSWSVTSESLTQAFQEYGNVVGARVIYDGKTGRSRGYGFVCYSTKSEMEAALQSLDGVELEGRAIRVSLAQGRKS
ncbi:hypothetical protein SLEP1_g295 [Rubroshorea leprosula]|uniref:RRM domain-containing protein n=1 Tax=Rubroshorea leprosula TaxID=152421 RepID=A0AAV5HES5_9ROSI|nr:hypothetical protein SLEP1_g295 [Rubroshorea leprosula]